MSFLDPELEQTQPALKKPHSDVASAPKLNAETHMTADKTDCPLLEMKYPPDLLKLFLVAFALSLFCWGYNFFTHNIRVDVEVFINEPGTLQGWLTIGRWGMYPLKLLLGNLHFNPYYAGALFLVLWPTSSVAWLILLEFVGGHRFKGRYFFIASYLLSHWWSYGFYFTNQTAEIAFCMVIIPIATILIFNSVSLFEQKKIVPGVTLILASLMMCTICFATYQSLVLATISCMAAALFIFTDTLLISKFNSRASTFLKRGLLCIGIFLLAFICYSVITSQFFSSTTYLSDQIRWQTDGIVNCIKAVLRYIRDVLISSALGETGLFSLTLIFSLFFVLHRLFRTNNNAHTKLFFVISYFVLLASPFLLALYMGSASIPRTQFSVPVVSAVLLLYICERFPSLNKLGIKEVIAWSFCILATTATVRGIALTWRNFYTDDIRYQQELSFARKITDDLSNQYGDDLERYPVVFIGKWSAPLNQACEKDDLWGVTLFEQDYMAFGNPAYNTFRINGFLRSALGVNYLDASPEQQDAAVIAANSMGTYPEESSIQFVDGVIVVNLEK